ncbi:katanin p80 WD40 repeat-containing subunit B1 isoform X2 [Festucalex cinctus]
MAASAGTSRISWRLQEFEAHAGRVCCASLGKSTGRLLASGGDDCKVNIWSVSKANCIMSLRGHKAAVECVHFSASEEQLATGSQSGSILVWDLEAAKMLRTLAGHKSSITSFGFHPYGDFLASGSTDSNIKMWDVRRKGPIYRYKGHTAAVRSVAFSPDGKWLASASDDCTVKLWDLKQAKTITEFTAHTAAVAAIQFHPNEYLLASAGADRWVRLWDLEKFCQVGALQDTAAVRCVMFSADGSCLFSGHTDVLGVCAWEPERWLDAVTVGWGPVADLTHCNQQLMGVSHQLSGVSTYVVDLKHVKRHADDEAALAPPADAKACGLRRSYQRPSQGLKRSAEAERRSPEGERRSPSEDEAEEKASSSAEIHDAQDYREIFRPRNAISRTPPRMPEPFAAPSEDELPVNNSLLFPDQQPGSPLAAPIQRVEPTVVACVKRPAPPAAGQPPPAGPRRRWQPERERGFESHPQRPQDHVRRPGQPTQEPADHQGRVGPTRHQERPGRRRGHGRPFHRGGRAQHHQRAAVAMETGRVRKQPSSDRQTSAEQIRELHAVRLHVPEDHHEILLAAHLGNAEGGALGGRGRHARGTAAKVQRVLQAAAEHQQRGEEQSGAGGPARLRLRGTADALGAARPAPVSNT